MNENKLNETKLKVGGIFTFEQIRDGEIIDTWVDNNIVVDEGLTYILDSALSLGTQSATFYVALFKNNYTPIAGNVISTFPSSGVANEATIEYDEATRPVWVEAGVSSKTITNSASPAVFTFNTTVTINGAFLVSESTKGGTTGKLIAASKFTSSRGMLDNDILNVTYTLVASST